MRHGGRSVDRSVLISNAAKRLVDEAITATTAKVAEAIATAAVVGRPGSGSGLAHIEELYLSGYQQACIAVLDKVQLEDRDNALDLADELRKSVLEPALNRFANLTGDTMVGPRPKEPAPFGDQKSLARYRAVDSASSKLRRIQANVVEEFQLAVTRQSPQKRQQVHMSAFVDAERIEALRAKSAVAWDFSRLIALCEELNTCWLYGAHHAVAMLTRAILDHVPPVFSQPNFAGVANQYSGGKSFGDVMKQLDKTSKAIADGHLHNQIRVRESVPTATQVDCRQGLDALLAEIVRIMP